MKKTIVDKVVEKIKSTYGDDFDVDISGVFEDETDYIFAWGSNSSEFAITDAFPVSVNKKSGKMDFVIIPSSDGFKKMNMAKEVTTWQT